MVENLVAIEQVRYLVLAAQREGNRVLGALLSKIGMTTSQAEVLRILDEHGALTLKELGEYVICEDASPSRLVAGMVSKGLLSRSISVRDKRAIDLSLTTAGQKFASDIKRIESNFYEQFASLDASQVESLSQLLRLLISDTDASRKFEKRFPSQPLVF